MGGQRPAFLWGSPLSLDLAANRTLVTVVSESGEAFHACCVLFRKFRGGYPSGYPRGVGFLPQCYFQTHYIAVLGPINGFTSLLRRRALFVSVGAAFRPPNCPLECFLIASCLGRKRICCVQPVGMSLEVTSAVPLVDRQRLPTLKKHPLRVTRFSRRDPRVFGNAQNPQFW